MSSTPGAAKSPLQRHDEGPRIRYNPFRKIARRTKQSSQLEHDDAIASGVRPFSPRPMPAAHEDTASAVGELFATSDLRSEEAANDNPTIRTPQRNGVVGQTFGRVVDEEQLSLHLVDTESHLNPWRPNFLLNTLGRAYTESKPSQNKGSLAREAPKSQNGTRKRLVIFVEFGNTDKLTEGTVQVSKRTSTFAYPPLVTAETVRRSWKEPAYSEMAAPGYPFDENGYVQSRPSSALSKPLKESLRKVCVSLYL